MRKIYQVDDIQLAEAESFPPRLIVTASGTAITSGWKNFVLRPLWNRTNPPVNGVYEFSFEGVPPTGIVLQVLVPTGPVSHMLSKAETMDAKRIIVYAASNQMAVEYKTEMKAETKAALTGEVTVDFSQTATGYSDRWDLQEAFRDAIRNLPPDPNPYPDKLYHFTITTIEAEIGGIAGLDRMKVIIEA